jgi:hypothetical protein
MTSCYVMKEKSLSLSPRHMERCISNCIHITNINIEKDIMNRIMSNILSDFCNASVIGYNRTTNKFWCKMYKRNICELHLEVEILEKPFAKSDIKIFPIIGTNILVENFVSNLSESIELYITSSFIRASLEGTLVL